MLYGYMTTSDRKIVASNKKAFHNYEILQKIEAGIVLVGCEVKSIREGHVIIHDAYAREMSNELWLIGSNIAPYSHGNRANPEPTRSRKLLLHRSELKKLLQKIKEKHLVLVPLLLYFVGGKVKLELGLGRSKNTYDKRADLKEKDSKRTLDRALRNRA